MARAAITEDQWLAELTAAIPRGRPPGKGWLTVAEISAKTDREKAAVQRHLFKHRKDYETANGSITSAAGKEQPVPFYRRRGVK